MRKVVSLVALGLVVLGTVIVIRTVRFTSKQVQVPPGRRMAVHRERVTAHLARAIQFRTISSQDPAQFDRGAFVGFHQYLEHTFPKVHATLTKEVVGDYSLLYTWAGGDRTLKPMLLMGHMDVVPVETGTGDDWTHPPFAGRIAEGFIWGRGAMDDKAGVLGVLEAVETLVTEGFQPRRTVYLAFGHDEEVGGRRGAAAVAALLQARGVELASTLDEGGAITEGIVPGVPAPVALVGIAEKGYVSLVLTVEGQGGHSSMPPKHTAIGVLSTAIHYLERNPFPRGLKGATRELFEYVGPEMTFPRRMLFANLWLFGWVVERQLAASPMTNALIRTTTAATMVEGGEKENVLPAQARAVVNVRILSGESIESVIDHVRRTINNPQVTIRPLELTIEPSPMSDASSPSFAILQRTIRQVFPEVVVAPWLVVGATDSRHYAKVSDTIYRFLPLRMGPEDTARLHGTDERIAVEDYADSVRFYAQLIRNSDDLESLEKRHGD